MWEVENGLVKNNCNICCCLCDRQIDDCEIHCCTDNATYEVGKFDCINCKHDEYDEWNELED